jgi:hypothetical protein
MSCHSCSSPALTHITMTMTDGSLVDFVSCHRCEAKAWRAQGEDLPLDRVLSLASRKK